MKGIPRIGVAVLFFSLCFTLLFSSQVFYMDMENNFLPSAGVQPVIKSNAITENFRPTFKKAHLGYGLIFPAGTVMEIPLRENLEKGSIEMVILITSDLPYDERMDILLTYDSFVLYLRQGLLYLTRGEKTLYLPVYHWSIKGKDIRDFIYHLVISWDTEKFSLIVDGREAIPSQISYYKSTEAKEKSIILGDKNNSLELLIDAITVFDTPISKKEAVDRYHSIFTKSVLFKQSIVTIPFFETPPVIDGEISEEIWKKATEISYFLAYKSHKIVERVSPRIFMGYDKEALYIAFKSPQPEGVISEKVPRDDRKIGQHDTFEFFFRPTMTWEHDYYQIVVNPSGSIFDGKALDTSWDGDFTYSSKIKDGFWYGEMKIPYSIFEGTGIPQQGEQWTFNVCRNFYAGGYQLSYWSYTGISYHSPDNFAELRFGSPDEWIKENTFDLKAGRCINIHLDADPQIYPEVTLIIYRRGDITPFKTIYSGKEGLAIKENAEMLEGGILETVLYRQNKSYPLYQRMFEF